MKTDMLVTNKYNYNGYVELYKTYGYIKSWNSSYKEKMLVQFSVIFSVCFLAFLLFAIFECNPILFDILTKILIVSPVAIGCHGIKKMHDYDKKEIASIKEKYPYVDTKIDICELTKSLKEAKILKESYSGLEVLKVDEYENYLKVEELKKEYFEETKYDRYVVNPNIQEEQLLDATEQLENVKVKKLVR